MRNYNLGSKNIVKHKSCKIAKSCRVGFTLAEVLITLAIVGVVAALVIPSLISSYKKRVIEVRLQNFYSTMQQVYKFSEMENGGFETWDYSLTSQEFYDKYYKNYLKDATIEYPNDNRFIAVKLMDGSMMVIGYTSCVNFYPTIPKNYYISACSNYELENNINKYGKDVFNFVIRSQAKCNFIPSGASGCYSDHVNTDYNTLMDNCANPSKGVYCTEIIRRNNWKIPDDYPVKI